MKRTLWLPIVAILGLHVSHVNAQQWRYTGSLSSEKRFVTFTALDNGKVLAVGGMNNDVPHAECELYDPATETWSLTGSLSVGRWVHSAVKLADGRVAVFGGQSGGSYDGYPIQTDIVEIYDPSTGTWSTAGQLQVKRQHQTASLLADGRVLVVGGLSDVSAVASAEIYDPSTQTSALVTPLHQIRYEHQATSLQDGRVMVTGGRYGGWDGTFLNESEIYDPTTDTWTVVDAMHQSRMRALLVQFSDGSVLSAAGRNTPTSTAPGSELYNISSDQWTSTDSMKQPCTWLSCVLFPDDRYLATGGFIDAQWTSSYDVTCTATTEWYDKQTATWFYAPTLNEARAQHGSAYMHQDFNREMPADFIIVGGGITGNSTFTKTCEILDVGMQAIGEYKAMPQNQPTTQSGVDRNVTSAITAKVIYDRSNEPAVEFSTTAMQDVSIELVASNGTVVRNYDQRSLPAGTYDLSLNAKSLPAGAYFVIVKSGASRNALKAIVTH